ncbi:MAG: TonB-dependent receptor [Chitinophagaceae bacterium]
MRKLFTLFAIAMTLSAAVSAQKISGIVKDDQGKGLAKTTLGLLRAKDSSTVKYSATDNDGKFSIGAEPGQYIISITHVGYAPFYSKAFEVAATGDVTVGDLIMIKTATAIQGVTVTSKKPMIEVKADRTIMNVEGTINATGNDALELLRKSPGVSIDKDDNISLSGKTGVQVFIDGKPSPLSGTDLSNYLKSLQSSQIESIELITNPSAKYEAAGNAGIINIRLKKNKTVGFNGSANAGYNIGVYPKYNGGINLNYRKNKVNLFGSYNFNDTRNQSVFNLFRTSSVDSSFDQHSVNLNKNRSHGFKAGLDFYANSKSTIGVMVNGNLSDNGSNNNSNTDIAYIPSKLVDRKLIAGNKTNGDRDNVNFNANYRFVDTAGHELNVDLDYGFYNSKNNQLQSNFTYNASATTLVGKDIYHSVTPSDIDIYSIKVDYEQNFKKGKLGYGGKVSFVQTDNTFNRYNETNTPTFQDHLNNFKYKENINAGYINYNRQFKGVMLQAGVRVENTVAKGHSLGFRYDYKTSTIKYIDTTFDRNYTSPFPSAAVTFNKNPMKQWSLTYSRRIDRPSYQNLNPFEFNLDKYTFQKGNPNLTPQYTNSFGITHIYKYKLTTTLNYSHIADMFATIPKSEGSNAFVTTENLATQNIVSLNVSMPVMYKKYSMFFNVNSFYMHLKGNGQGFNVDQGIFSVNVYAQQTYKVSKTGTAELSAYYTSPSIYQGGFKAKALGTVDAGYQQILFKGKVTAKASLTDVFRTLRFYATNNTTGQTVRANGSWESRQFRINFSYRFGNNKTRAARNRKGGLDEENKRTQDGGGIGIGGGGN